MPKYNVVLFYHASATFQVEAEDEDKAVELARWLSDNELDKEFYKRLKLELKEGNEQVDEAPSSGLTLTYYGER